MKLVIAPLIRYQEQVLENVIRERGGNLIRIRLVEIRVVANIGVHVPKFIEYPVQRAPVHGTIQVVEILEGKASALLGHAQTFEVRSLMESKFVSEAG